MIQVYEYYDGYEFEKNRPKVQYFVLGETDSGHVAICYAEYHSFIAKIGRGIHSCAWEKRMIGEKEAIKYIQSCKKELVSDIDRQIEDLILHKEELDKEHACLPGHSASCSGGSIVESFHYKHGESYTEKKIESLMAKRNLLCIRDEFLTSLQNAVGTTVDVDSSTET